MSDVETQNVDVIKKTFWFFTMKFGVVYGYGGLDEFFWFMH